MNFFFEIKHNTISPYAIMLFISFIVSFTVAIILMFREHINKELAILSAFLNMILALYIGYVYTVISSGFDLNNIGFSSIGGFFGVILGCFILGKLFKEYKSSIFRAYSTIIPLTYSISKLGCFLVGCCHGIEYNGIFNVHYINSNVAMDNINYFPIQLVETIIFFVIFIISIYINYIVKYNNGIYIILYICSIIKFMLDYLRYSHKNEFLSFNQLIILIIVAVVTLKNCASKEKRQWMI